MPISYVFKIGITGHIQIANSTLVNELLSQVIRDIEYEIHTLKGYHKLDYRMHMYSGMAVGADRLALKQLLKDFPQSTYTAVLPLPVPDFIKDFAANPADVTEFNQLLGNSLLTIEYDGKIPVSERPHCYQEAGKKVVINSDVMIAVWNGIDNNLVGGTSDIVKYCRVLNKPLWIINPIKGTITCSTEKIEPMVKNTIKHACAFFKELVDFKICRFVTSFISLPDAITAIHHAQEPQQDVIKIQSIEEIKILNERRRSTPLQDTALQMEFPGIEELNYLYSNTDVLALDYQKKFRRRQSIKIVSAFAATFSAGAAMCFQIYHQHTLSHIMHYVEIILVLTIGVLFIIERYARSQHKWIQFRFLAEKLRLAIVAKCCGIQLFNYDSSLSSTLVFRFKEVIDMPPIHTAVFSRKLEIVDKYYIDDQVQHHTKKIGAHQTIIERIEILTFVIFAVLFLFLIRTLLPDWMQLFYKMSEAPVWFGMAGIAVPASLTFFISLDALYERKKLKQMSEAALAYYAEIRYNLNSIKNDAMLRRIVNSLDRFATRDTFTWFKLYEAERNELG